MGAHLIDGEFQSDKYPTCPRGKLPLSFKDPMAQDLIHKYGQRRRPIDNEFSDDVESALLIAGYNPQTNPEPETLWCCHVRGPDDVYAAPDFKTALEWADSINALNWRRHQPVSYEDCLLKALPAPWPWSAEAHAENLPKSIADFAMPADERANG